MSFKITTMCRTTGRVSDLVTKVDEKTNVERKSIFFTVVSDRPYKVTKTVGGKETSESISDYVFCRATGNIAELIDKSCKYPSGKKDKKGKDIYVSRLLELTGHLETFESKIPVEVKNSIYLSVLDKNVQSIQLGIRGEGCKSPASCEITTAEKKAEMKFAKTDVKFKDFVFVVKEVEFGDASPKGTPTTSLLNATDNIFTLNMSGESVAPTSNSTDNANSTGDGNKEAIIPINSDKDANTKTEGPNENIIVGDGDIPIGNGIFDGVPGGDAPF